MNTPDQTARAATIDPAAAAGPISVSVIIPMRNEQRYVARCLDSVLAQVGGRHDVEVLCVDGASRDNTAHIVEQYAANHPSVRLIRNPGQIVPRGMNIGLAEARGEVVIRLDCHAEYAPDYIDRCIEVLQRSGADNVGGYMRTLPGDDTPAGRAIAAATSSRFGVGASAFRTGGTTEREVDTVPFGCFRASVFRRFGLYDERLVRNQDIELNTRIRRGGGRIVISPAIRLTYYNRSTYAGLRQQAFQNGLWNPYTLLIAGGGLRPRHFAPAAFVAVLLLSALTGVWWRAAWFLFAGVAGLYVAAAGLMSVRAARESGAGALRILWAFVQLHFAYGLGSLWGFLSGPFKFGLRRRPARALADRIE